MINKAGFVLFTYLNNSSVSRNKLLLYAFQLISNTRIKTITFQLNDISSNQLRIDMCFHFYLSLSTASYQIHQMLFQAFGFYNCSKFTNKDIFIFAIQVNIRPQHELQEFSLLSSSTRLKKRINS